jgi:hypothetical protein
VQAIPKEEPTSQETHFLPTSTKGSKVALLLYFLAKFLNQGIRMMHEITKCSFQRLKIVAWVSVALFIGLQFLGINARGKVYRKF